MAWFEKPHPSRCVVGIGIVANDSAMRKLRGKRARFLATRSMDQLSRYCKPHFANGFEDRET